MQRYLYTARDENGKIVKGVMMADDEVSLANKISQLGYFLTKYNVSQEIAGEARKLKMPHMNPKELLQFTFQLSTLIDAGLPLLEGLKDLARESEDVHIQRIIDDIRYRVESGSSLKEALMFHPRSFPKLFVAIVGAGEATGKMSQALNDLSAMMEWQQELQSKIKEAATYPIILSLVLVGVVTLLVVRVIPMFKPMFEDLGASLPLPTLIVLATSDFVRSYGIWAAGAIVGLVFLLKFYGSTPGGKYMIDGLKLKMPIFGVLVRKIVLSRFSHTFALGVKSGINLLTCLDIARETCGNSRVEKVIAKVRDSVNVGEKLATSLQMSGEFPPLVVRMISVGEASGALTQTLTKVAEFYDKEVAASVKKMFAMFEPLMIVFMGVVVGGIALSIFMPIFKMSQMIGGG
jgi:type IV pilus assembly protein PilC